MEVKAKLKRRFRIKGRRIVKGILFRKNIRNTFPKETAIRIYNKVHTGANIQAGGAQPGLMSCSYQEDESILKIY
jgi:hypothetical protein